MKKSIWIAVSAALALGMTANVHAGCEKTQGGKKSEFSGDSLQGLSVDKKALATLNKKFPQLNITEKVFSGNIQTCTGCTDNFVTCSE